MAMKIGLIDVDVLDNGTRHPNLALMKISAFCKEFDTDVRFLFTDDDMNSLNSYDVIIASKVFTFSSLPYQLESLLDRHDLKKYNLDIPPILHGFFFNIHSPVIAIGGTGFFEDGGRNLDSKIEHHMPDYHLYDEFIKTSVESGQRRISYYYDYLNYSIGFTSRGCFRKCDFCVNKKYKKCTRHSSVSEFLDESRPRIYLWDDNVFACAHWMDIFDELDATGKPFQFRQGLDIRLLSEPKIKRLSLSKYYGDIIFAFDHVDDYEKIEQKLSLWRKYSTKATKLYLICAFDSNSYMTLDDLPGEPEKYPYLRRMVSLETQDERDQLDIEYLFVRIQLLMKYGCLPYVMRYESYKDSKYRGMYIQIARWCNQPNIYKKMTFREFCIANQNYAKTDRICSAYRAMLEFEKERPDIAERYFDMRYVPFRLTISD